MSKIFKLVLIEHIESHEKDGWQVATGKVATNLGGWASVYMVKDDND